MELFIVRHAEWERFYNCSSISIDSVPLAERQQKFIPETIASVLMATILLILYFPCTVSIWRRMNKNACYQFLFHISMLDIVTLFGLSYYMAWANFTGSVFCSAPVFNYWASVIIISCSLTENLMDAMLAVNRALDMLAPVEVYEFFFSEKGTRNTILIAYAYFVFLVLFIRPNLYCSIFFLWFDNPYAGYKEPNPVPAFDMYGYVHTTSNTMLFAFLPSVYAIFGIALVLKMKKNGRDSLEAMRSQLMIFLQVGIISLFNALNGFLYIIFATVPSGNPEITQILMMICQFAWFFTHGSPPVIYLTMNKTIRKDTKNMLAQALENLANGLRGGANPHQQSRSNATTRVTAATSQSRRHPNLRNQLQHTNRIVHQHNAHNGNTTMMPNE